MEPLERAVFLFGNIKELNYICPMQPKAKFWVDFFNYLFRVVTFKKIIPQPRKIKRLNKIMSFESRMHITSIMSKCGVGERGVKDKATYKTQLEKEAYLQFLQSKSRKEASQRISFFQWHPILKDLL